MSVLASPVDHEARPLPVPPIATTISSKGASVNSAESIAGNGMGTALIAASGITSEGGDPIVCNGCKLGLEETGDSVLVSFGSSLWHVDCRCAKCKHLVEHDTNLLLLSDGSPVCENCSYICSVCTKPISNEAIVTGDESYHAECFRCRSCSSKIEELIFAKTSQGIWCMACHNERVARSRKHAEAKRNRGLKKEREKDKERDKDRTREKADNEIRPSRRKERDVVDGLGGPSTSPSDFFELPATPDTPSGLSFDGGVSPPVRQLPPTPTPHLPNVSRSDFSPHRRLSRNTLPLLNSTDRRGSSQTDYSSSMPQSRRASAQTQADINQSESQTSPQKRRNVQDATSETPVLPSTQIIPSTSGDGPRWPPVPNSTEEGNTKQSLETYPSRPFGLDDYTLNRSVNGSSQDGSPQMAQGSRSGSLSTLQPVDKVTSRRSGFYGTMGVDASPDTEDKLKVPNASTRTDAEQSEHYGGAPGTSALSPVARSISNYSPESIEDVPSTEPPELYSSISFYDPDTLLFLDHVGPEGSLRQASKTFTSVDAGDHVEHLSPDLTNVLSSADEDEAADTQDFGRRRPSDGKSEVARKVRESIRISREGIQKDGSMYLDIDLVEMLLKELDGTKKEMLDLQTKYHAFRRVSRSAFEGFSMAREEYDKEVAARQEAEAAMDILRIKFTEQALKLATMDKERQNTEALKRQSKSLRDSVVGMEAHLSHLRAEVEISTAHIEELATRESLEVGDSRQMHGIGAIEASLDGRLVKVKDEHRREIELLVQERDGLQRDVDNLKHVLGSHLEDTRVLELRKAALTDQNSEASKKLEAARENISTINLSLGNRSPVHSHLAHSQGVARSSAISPVPSTRYLQAKASPTSTSIGHEFDQEHNARPEAHAHSKAKFKWGKGKADNYSKSAKDGSSGNVISAVPSTVGAKTLPLRSQKSMESHRPHGFAQTSILRPVRCEFCGDKMWGLNEVRCTACGCYAHAKCAGSLQTPCTSFSNSDDTSAGTAMFGNNLIAQVHKENRPVPLVVTKCIAAVETYGMNYEGIYRKTGGMGQTKLITQFFERGQDFDLEDLDKFNDLAAITSCMKNFFRSLPDPLFTHELHEDFVSCAEMTDGEERLIKLEQTLRRLPEPHYNTAHILIGHLHRVHLQSNENKMTPANLGVVFGPTVLRSSNPSREFSDMGSKAKLVEMLVDNYTQLFESSPTK